MEMRTLCALGSCLVLLVLGGVAVPAAGQVAPEDTAAVLDLRGWEGSWGSWAAGPGGDLFGGSVTIAACDAASATCTLRLDSESPTTRCGLTKDARLMVASASRATGHFVDYDGAPKRCMLALTRGGTPAAPRLQASFTGEECGYFCTNGPSIPAELPRRSAHPFPAGWTRQCFADAGPARAVWCADDALQAADAALVEQADAVEGYLHDPKIAEKLSSQRQDTLAGCDVAADPRACLRDAYAELAAAWSNRLAVARQAYGREQAALAAPGDAARGAALAREIAGVYKHRFANALVSGEGFTSEDILELVPVEGSALYLRVHLEFFNGHTCDQWGIAHFASTGAFVYREAADPAAPEEGASEGDRVPPCQLQVVVAPEEIRLVDPGHTCTTSCGARGSLDGAAFARRDRREIRYLDRLLRSQQYRDAVAEDEKKRSPGD